MNVAADDTDPRQSEETPRESETKFRLLFERSPDAMLLLDGNVFVDCNQAAVEMMRCASKEQLLAFRPYDISPERQPDGRLSSEKARDLIAAAFREGSLRFEWVHRAVDGTDFPVEVLLTAIPLRGEKVLHVAWRDISERKQADEELREREAQYRGIFESTSDGLLIFDFDGTIVDANPAACRMYGYPYEELIGLSSKEIVHPDYYRLFEDFERQVQANGRFSAQTVDLRQDGSPINVEVHGASFNYKGKPHLLAVVRDVTERVHARQILERHVEERTREIERRRQVAEGLRDILKVLNSNRPLDEILDYIVDQASRLLGANAGVIYRLEVAEELIIVEATCGMPADFVAIETVPLTETDPNQAVLNRRPFAVPDLADRLKTIYQDDAELPPGLEEWAAVVGEHFCAYLSVPLIVRDKVYGTVSLYYHEPREFSDEEIELAVSLSDQAALAIENARLFEAEQRRAEQFRVINKLGRRISSVLDLDQLLWAVVHLVKETFGYYNMSIFLVDPETNELVLKASVGGYVSGAPSLGDRLKIGEEGILGWIAATGEPLLVNDVSREPRYYATPMLPDTRSELGVPIKVRGQVVGTLDVQSTELNAFDQDDLTTLQTMADQIGVAVENARLFTQAERSAAAAERSRLARDLHDAVTQTLFSASLIAEVLPRIWERHPDEGRRRLDELRELTRGALAEMRTLLLELRPSALVEARLTDLLHQIAESITGRARVPVTVEVEGECDLPVEAKVALYRIAHEALNNVAKHAGASQATVSLRCAPPFIPPAGGGDRGGAVELRISDDGRGFDPEGIPPESLGLGIMRERAEAIGAALDIDSEVGHGTQVVVVWKDTGGEEQL